MRQPATIASSSETPSKRIFPIPSPASSKHTRKLERHHPTRVVPTGRRHPIQLFTPGRPVTRVTCCTPSRVTEPMSTDGQYPRVTPVRLVDAAANDPKMTIWAGPIHSRDLPNSPARLGVATVFASDDRFDEMNIEKPRSSPRRRSIRGEIYSHTGHGVPQKLRRMTQWRWGGLVPGLLRKIATPARRASQRKSPGFCRGSGRSGGCAGGQRKIGPLGS